MGELPHNKLCCLSEIFLCAVVCLTMAAFLHISWVVRTAGERRQCINRNNFNCRLLSDVRPNELSVSAFMDHLYVHASVKCWTVCVETVGNQRCCKKHTPIKLYLSCTSRICWWKYDTIQLPSFIGRLICRSPMLTVFFQPSRRELTCMQIVLHAETYARCQ